MCLRRERRENEIFYLSLNTFRSWEKARERKCHLKKANEKPMTEIWREKLLMKAKMKKERSCKWSYSKLLKFIEKYLLSVSSWRLFCLKKEEEEEEKKKKSCNTKIFEAINSISIGVAKRKLKWRRRKLMWKLKRPAMENRNEKIRRKSALRKPSKKKRNVENEENQLWKCEAISCWRKCKTTAEDL